MAEAKLATIAFKAHPGRPEIVHCPDGEAFLRLLENTPLGEICYVLLDLNMPRLSGIEVLRILAGHQDWRKIPTIIFTSSAFDKDIQTCYELGANAYVVKPVEYDELDLRLNAIHAFWAGANMRPHFPPLGLS